MCHILETSTRIIHGEPSYFFLLIYIFFHFVVPCFPTRHRIEAVELLVASLFSDEAPLAPPATGLAGFLRFLLLLAGHDWATAPLLVDPQSELTAADREAAVEAFTFSRDRGACFFFSH